MTANPERTLRLGRKLGEILCGGIVVALIGDLGAGKTLLTKGIAAGLGVEDPAEVTSPTFVLVNEYRGRIPIYHLDLYRLSRFSEVEEIGWDEWVDGPGVTIVEWADKIEADLPEDRLEIRLQWAGELQRRLVFRGLGSKAEQIVEDLRSRWIEEE